MQEIAIITDDDFNIFKKENNEEPEIRTGARGIVFNKEGKIAVFIKKHKNEYKLPGGGVDPNEDVEVAFKRECLEEIGYNIKIITKLGTIIEDKSQENFKQISHIFVAKTISKEERNLTKQEEDEGAEFTWLSIEEAIEKMTSNLDNLIGSKYDNIYRTKFMVLRDIKILEYYKKNIE